MECPPLLLNTARLKPFRQRINRTTMTITDGGCVSMEIMCRHGNQPDSQEITRELFHVSPDGRTVEVYQNADGVAAIDGCPIPGQPCKVYTFPELPVKQMKKYQHSYKFVELVKSRTAKVVLVTDAAQCKLMENSEPADFKADFNNGSTVVISKSGVTVTDKDGGSLSFDTQTATQWISPDTLALVGHANMCHLKCLEIERSVSNIHSTDGGNQLFPVTIGSARSPYQIQPESQSVANIGSCQKASAVESPLSAQAQESRCKAEAWLHERELGQTRVAQAYRGSVSDISASQHGPIRDSLSEAELCDLLARQLTEFGGSSRGSSVKSMSRSITPQKRNSFPQCGQAEGVYPPASCQQHSASVLSADSYENNHIDTSVCRSEFQNSVSISNNDQYVVHSTSASKPKDFSRVPSSPFSHNETNIRSPYLPQEAFLPQPETEETPVSSTSSPHPSPQDMRGSHTPQRDSLRHHHQLQRLDRLHGLSVDSWKTRPQQQHHLHHHSEHHHHHLPMEHQRSLAPEKTPSPNEAVRRKLIADLDLNLSQPAPSPSSGALTLSADLLAVQRTPSLDLSDCSEGVEGRDVSIKHATPTDSIGGSDRLTESSHGYTNSVLSDTMPHSVSDRWAMEQFNRSVSIPSTTAESNLSEDDGMVSMDDGAMFLSQSLPLLGYETSLHQAQEEPASSQTHARQTRNAPAISSEQSSVHEHLNTPAVTQSEFQTSPLSPQRNFCSKTPNRTVSPHKTVYPPKLPATSSHSMTPQKGFLRSGISLRLTSTLNNRRHSSSTNSNLFATNPTTTTTTACSNNNNNSSSNSSSGNSSGCLDLPSPHSSLPSPHLHPALPAQLRHSLDMSMSSHYSDSSVPSSSGGGGGPGAPGGVDIVRQLFVPYTGWASLHATGAVWILYNDGTQLGLRSAQPAMTYVDQDGAETTYSTTDLVPEIVKLKLERLPSIVDQLMKTQPLPSAQANQQQQLL